MYWEQWKHFFSDLSVSWTRSSVVWSIETVASSNITIGLYCKRAQLRHDSWCTLCKKLGAVISINFQVIKVKQSVSPSSTWCCSPFLSFLTLDFICAISRTFQMSLSSWLPVGSRLLRRESWNSRGSWGITVNWDLTESGAWKTDRNVLKRTSSIIVMYFCSPECMKSHFSDVFFRQQDFSLPAFDHIEEGDGEGTLAGARPTTDADSLARSAGIEIHFETIN